MGLLVAFLVARPLDVGVVAARRRPLGVGVVPGRGTRDRWGAYHIAVAEPGGEDRPAPPDVDVAPQSRVRLEAAGNGPLDRTRVYLTNDERLLRALHAYGKQMAGGDRSALVRLVAPGSLERLLGAPPMPVRLGNGGARDCVRAPLDAQLDVLARRRTGRFALISQLNSAFGDALMTLRVYTELRRALEARFTRVDLHVCHPPLNAETDALYLRSGVVDAIHAMPISVSRLAGYDGYFEVHSGDLNAEEHWLDQYLRRVGLDPGAIPPDRKRTVLPPLPAMRPDVVAAVHRARERRRPVLLFQPYSVSVMRSCPPDRARALAYGLLERTPWTVASAAPLDVRHPRYHDWSTYSGSFDEYTYLVSQADVLLSIDSSAYHVADAYSVPSVVLFATVRPELRMAYYPAARGIMLETLRGGTGALVGCERVPRRESDWAALDLDAVVRALRGALGLRQGVRPS